jgi:hypothetical protein
LILTRLVSTAPAFGGGGTAAVSSVSKSTESIQFFLTAGFPLILAVSLSGEHRDI